MVKLSHKRQIAVQEYCSNGFNWLQALLTAKYSESYAKHSGYKLLDNTGISTAIKHELEQRQLKTGYNREKAEQMLFCAYEMAANKSDSSAMTSACRELNALFGLRQESGQQQSLVISVSERPGHSPEPEHGPDQPRMGQAYGQTASELNPTYKAAEKCI